MRKLTPGSVSEQSWGSVKFYWKGEEARIDDPFKEFRQAAERLGSHRSLEPVILGFPENMHPGACWQARTGIGSYSLRFLL